MYRTSAGEKFRFIFGLLSHRTSTIRLELPFCRQCHIHHEKVRRIKRLIYVGFFILSTSLTALMIHTSDLPPICIGMLGVMAGLLLGSIFNGRFNARQAGLGSMDCHASCEFAHMSLTRPRSSRSWLRRGKMSGGWSEEPGPNMLPEQATLRLAGSPPPTPLQLLP